MNGNNYSFRRVFKRLVKCNFKNLVPTGFCKKMNEIEVNNFDVKHIMVYLKYIKM